MAAVRLLARLLVPGGFLLVVGVLLTWRFPEYLADVTSRYALVVYVVGAVPAFVFHRSRVVIALMGLAFLDLAVPPGGVAGPRFDALVTFVIVLLGLLAIVRDRGVISRWGGAQLAAAVSLGVGAWFAVEDPDTLVLFTAVALTGFPLSDWTGLAEPVVVGAVLGVLLSLYAIQRWRGPVEQALFWSQLALLVSVFDGLTLPQSEFLLMVAGLILAVSVLESSYSMAYRDELTGLPGRRALVRELSDLGGTYTLAMVDVDHFKGFNDKHGHDVGDQVLQLVASRLADGPGGGKAYRYGGEEFTIVYPGRVRKDAEPHAEAVRAAVEDASFSLRAWNRPRKKPTDGRRKKRKRRPKQLSVTVSIGLADSTGKDASTEAVLKKADKALYRAKRDGRNRVSR